MPTCRPADLPTCQLADGGDGGDDHADDDGERDGTSDHICDGNGDEDSDGDDGGDEPAALGMHLGTRTNKLSKILIAGGLALCTAPQRGMGPRADLVWGGSP